MNFQKKESSAGFTLLELLIVIIIITILLAVVVASTRQSRDKGIDAGLKSQSTEILKALELHYSDNGSYPVDGTPGVGTTGDVFANIGSGFLGGNYLKRLPPNADRFQYCLSGDGQSLALAIDTIEEDVGDSNYCTITRGDGSTGDGFGCDAWIAGNAWDPCSTRF